MRKIAALICAVFALFSIFFAGCAPFTFAFLSVRLKGNGDGTVTAVAQHEFSLGGPDFDVTLTLFRRESAGSENITEVKSARGGLSAFKTLEITADIGEAGYYFARLDYEVNGKTEYTLSDTVYYGADGVRENP